MKKQLSKKHQARADILRSVGDSLTSVQLGEMLGVHQTTIRRWWTGAMPINDLEWSGIKAELQKAGYEL